MAGQKGIALFLVLWVLTLLSVIVTEFCFSMRTEINIARNFKEQTEARYIALAGVNRAIAGLLADLAKPAGAAAVADETDDGTLPVRWRINADIPPVSFDNGSFQVRIDNESGKVNLNHAESKLLQIALESFALDKKERETIVDAILDWRDMDDLHRINGAENDYYQSLPNPYPCKNGEFDSIPELLLVKGITPELYHGGLSQMVTIYSDKEKKKIRTSIMKKINTRKRKYDYNKVNINSAPEKMLLSLPGMTRDAVQNIQAFREEKDILYYSELIPLTGSEIYGKILPYISFERLPYYTIRSKGTVDNSHVAYNLTAVVRIDPGKKGAFRMVQWMDE